MARYLTNLEHKDDALHADYPVIYDLLDECCLDLDLGILKDLMPKYFCIKFVFTYITVWSLYLKGLQYIPYLRKHFSFDAAD